MPRRPYVAPSLCDGLSTPLLPGKVAYLVTISHLERGQDAYVQRPELMHDCNYGRFSGYSRTICGPIRASFPTSAYIQNTICPKFPGVCSDASSRPASSR